MRMLALTSALLLIAATAHAVTVSATITGTMSGEYYPDDSDVVNGPSEYFLNQPFTLVLYGDQGDFSVENHRDGPGDGPAIEGSFTLGDISGLLANVEGGGPYVLEVGDDLFGLSTRLSSYYTVAYTSDRLIGYNYDHDFSVTGLNPIVYAGATIGISLGGSSLVGFDTLGGRISQSSTMTRRSPLNPRQFCSSVSPVC